jgi:hypothetical protein
MRKQQRIEAAEASINFRAHAIDRKVVSKDVAAVLKTLPKDRQPCRIRGAMAGMWEPAIVCGYMMTSQGLKALIIYDEREHEDGSPVIDFVPVARIMKPKATKLERDILDRRFR